MTASWKLPEVTTSTGVDTGAMPTTDLEQAAWDASAVPVSTGVGTDGTTSTRAIDSDGRATSEQESNSSRLISVEDSFDIDRWQELHLHES